MIQLAQFFSFVLYRFPPGLLAWCGNRMGDLVYYVFPFRRKSIMENLQKGLGLKPEEAARMAHANYRHYGNSLLETIQSLSWTEADYKKIRFIGKEHIQPLLDKGEGAFLLCCHFGSWEVGAAGLVANGIPLDIVVKRATSPRFENFLTWFRRKKGLGLIVETGTAKDILRALSKGQFVGFMLDQFMGPPVGIPVSFMGREAGTPAAVALLTEKRAYPVFPAYSRRSPEHGLTLVIEPALQYPLLSASKDERIYAKTQLYNETIERIVRTAPEQWLWLHRRWKPFRGKPKWQLASLGFLLLLSGCVSAPRMADMIELPPEPEIAVPNFEKMDRVVISEYGSDKMIAGKDSAPKAANKKALKKTKEKPISMYSAGSLPFDIGEQTVLKLRWMMIPAGNATLEVKDGPEVQGRPTFELSGHARTNSVVDRIYRVDNRSVSLVDKQALIPYRFELTMDETHQNKFTRVKFDHVNKVIHYQAERKSTKWGDQKEDRKDEAKPFVKDLFTALFFVRTLDYQLNRTESFYLYENGKTFEVRLTPVANEFMNVEVGAFQCWKIKVELALNNVLSPTGDIFMWLSDDSKQYIVKFDAKIKIGSLNGELISIRDKNE